MDVTVLAFLGIPTLVAIAGSYAIARWHRWRAPKTLEQREQINRGWRAMFEPSYHASSRRVLRPEFHQEDLDADQ